MRIRFDFVGGPKDGESVIGDLNGVFGSAVAYYHASQNGFPGTLLWCRTDYLVELMQMLSDSALDDLRSNGSPLRGHLYEVFCRSTGPHDVLIRARHVGPTPGAITQRSRSDVESGVPSEQAESPRESN